METGLAYFGLEEVNQRIASGARLVEIRPGGAVMSEVGEDADSVSLTLGGCQFQVVFEDA
jgi:hypothetical protein